MGDERALARWKKAEQNAQLKTMTLSSREVGESKWLKVGGEWIAWLSISKGMVG